MIRLNFHPAGYSCHIDPYIALFSYAKHREKASIFNSIVKRLFVLLCGFEILPKTISTRGRGGRFILSEPVCAYLLDTENGWVLLDAGIHPANACDPGRMQEKFWSLRMTPPVVRDAHLLATQFGQIGVAFADVRHVILSHLHYDHCGELHHFAHARISVQRREYEHAFGSAPGMAYFRDEYDLPGLQWDLRDGDWEAFPGLRLLDTRGHTEGHQSAAVSLADAGTLLLPFDAGDLQENFDSEILPGECCDDEAARRALLRIKDLSRREHTSMLLFHDPVAIQEMRLAPNCYR